MGFEVLAAADTAPDSVRMPDLADGPVGLVLVDRSGRPERWNRRALDIFDPASDSIGGKPLPLGHGVTLASLAHAGTKPSLLSIRRPDGTRLSVFALVQERPAGYLVHLIDAEDFAREQRQLAYMESIWRHAIEAAGHGVWDYNGKNEEIFCSDTWKKQRGFPLDEHFGDSYEKWIDRIHPDDRDDVIEMVRKQNEGELEDIAIEYRERHVDGHWVWILARGKVVQRGPDGRPTHVVGTDIDITAVKEAEARRAEELMVAHRKHVAELQGAWHAANAARQEAHQQARVDFLTGFGNRRAFEELTGDLCASREREPFAVLLVGLDRLKAINGIFGYLTGDAVIRAAAERLANAVQGGLITRLSGDEFGIVLRGAETASDETIHAISRCISEAFMLPIKAQGHSLDVGATIGAARFPEHGMDFQSLMRCADMALSIAKMQNRGSYTIYTPRMGRDADLKAAIEADLKLAIAADEIEPYFQPIIDAATGEIRKFEVLARWRNHKLGFVAPDLFIHLAEKAGLLPQLSTSLLRKACAAAKQWPQDVMISVNLTAREVCDAATPVRILDTLLKAGIPPHRIDLEVTEQALINNFDTAKQVVAALRAAGIRVYLDDFGAGYAGIGYLRRLSFDGLKFDRSCVAPASQDPASHSFLSALQTLATTLGLKTVAEGIEDEAAWNTVKALGCTMGQGYHFSKAVPAAEATALLLPRTGELKKAG